MQMKPEDKKAFKNKTAEVNHVRNLLKNVPDERADKVRTLKTGVNEGSYKVNVEQVAEKMIERTLKTAASKKKDA